jgi:hypothetical protein
MGNYGENMETCFDFDPSQGKLVPKRENDNSLLGYTSSKNGGELEFDSTQSKLVPRYENGTSNSRITEQTYKNDQEFDFDPASSRLVPKKESVDEVEHQMRCPKEDRSYGFDKIKSKKSIKVEKTSDHRSTSTKCDRQVKVDMKKRGTGGFF